MVMYFSLQNIRLLLFSLFCDLKLRKDEHEEYLIWLSYRKNKLTCHICRDRFWRILQKIKERICIQFGSTPPKNYISKSCFEHSFSHNNCEPPKCKCRWTQMKQLVFSRTSLSYLVYAESFKSIICIQIHTIFHLFFPCFSELSIYNKSRRYPGKYSCNLGQIIRKGKESLQQNTNNPLYGLDTQI